MVKDIELGRKLLEDGFSLMLEGLHVSYGLNLNDENFIGTPQRVAKAYLEMNKGIDTSQAERILKQNFPSSYTGMVVIDKIQCYSMCPHHFLPVRYTVNFGYIPNGHVLGLSKIPRFIKLLAQSPKLQEDFTQEVVTEFDKYVTPLGSAVFVEGYHLCMGARGVEMPEAATLTSAISGTFLNNTSAKEEFFSIINKRR